MEPGEVTVSLELSASQLRKYIENTDIICEDRLGGETRFKHLMEITVFIAVFCLKCERGLAHLTVSQLQKNWSYQLHLKSFGFSQKYQAVLRRKALLIFLAVHRLCCPMNSRFQAPALLRVR